MKKNRIWLKAVIMATVMLSLGSVKAQAENSMGAPEDEIVIEGRKPAHFNHTTHITLGLSCATCHHDQDHQPLTAEAIAALADATGLQCVSCHNSDFANGELQKAKDVFHARCRTCHKEGYQGKNGPTKCSSCHIKKKKAYEGC